jgi:hypothetical protein
MITDFFFPKSKKRSIRDVLLDGREQGDNDDSEHGINELPAAQCNDPPTKNGLVCDRYVFDFTQFGFMRIA